MPIKKPAVMAVGCISARKLGRQYLKIGFAFLENRTYIFSDCFLKMFYVEMYGKDYITGKMNV